MKKGIVLLAVALLIIAAAFLIDTLQNSDDKKAEIAVTKNATASESASSDLPQISLTLLDGSRQTARDLKGKTVLVIFQPDCDHCRRKAVQIREHLEAFSDYAIYFVSDAALPQLRQFAQEPGLADKGNGYFAQTPADDITNAMGPVEQPSVFVYSEKGRLVQSFIGEKPIEDVLKVL